MKTDKIIISYSKINNTSCLLVGRDNEDGTTTIINEAKGIEADTLYGILIGYLKMNNNVGYYFSINANQEDHNA
jgi:hypothetical protein